MLYQMDLVFIWIWMYLTDYMLYLVDKISVKEIDNWENEKD